MNLKKVIAALAAILSMTVSAGAIDLYVDSVQLQPDVPPTVISGRTLVPLRSIFEAIGAAVEWDNASQTATGYRGDSTVIIQLGNQTAFVNGEARTLDVPAQAVSGRTMVPARFVAEALDCQVNWDSAAQAVYVTTSAGTADTPAAPDTTIVVAPTVIVETPKETPAQQPAVSHTVYITKTGKRYHYDNSCNGGTYYESTLAEAQRRGLTPCQKCVLD